MASSASRLWIHGICVHTVAFYCNFYSSDLCRLVTGRHQQKLHHYWLKALSVAPSKIGTSGQRDDFQHLHSSFQCDKATCYIPCRNLPCRHCRKVCIVPCALRSPETLSFLSHPGQHNLVNLVRMNTFRYSWDKWLYSRLTEEHLQLAAHGSFKVPQVPVLLLDLQPAPACCTSCSGTRRSHLKVAWWEEFSWRRFWNNLCGTDGSSLQPRTFVLFLTSFLNQWTL